MSHICYNCLPRATWWGLLVPSNCCYSEYNKPNITVYRDYWEPTIIISWWFYNYHHIVLTLF